MKYKKGDKVTYLGCLPLKNPCTIKAYSYDKAMCRIADCGYIEKWVCETNLTAIEEKKKVERAVEMENIYKAEDKVRIKTREEMEKDGYVNQEGLGFRKQEGSGFCRGLYSTTDEKFVVSQGGILTIAKTTGDTFSAVRPDGTVYSNAIPVWAIKDYAFEYGQEIEVTDDGDKWQRGGVFLCYAPNGEYVSYSEHTQCVSTHKRARPFTVKKPVIKEVTLAEVAKKFGVSVDLIKVVDTNCSVEVSNA